MIGDRWPDCFVCNDEGWVLWDDDQSRYRGATFGFRLSREQGKNPDPCPHSKVLAPGHGFNSERSQRAENGGRP